MTVLAAGQPLPLVRQPQVDAETVERGVGAAEVAEAGGSGLTLRLVERIVRVQGGVHQALHCRMPEGAR